MSPLGTKRTYRHVCYLTAFGDKADISDALEGDQLIRPVDPKASLPLLLTPFGAVTLTSFGSRLDSLMINPGNLYPAVAAVSAHFAR